MIKLREEYDSLWLYDKEVTLQERVEEIAKNIDRSRMLTIEKVDTEYGNGFIQLFVKCKAGVGFSAWVNVDIDDGEIRIDWNQDIFFLSKKMDRFQKLVQENHKITETVFDFVLDYIIDKEYVFYDDMDGYGFTGII